MEPIPQEWIKQYVDDLLLFAERLKESNLLRDACLLRAEHAMDLVKAFRAHTGDDPAS
jgi:hypothetical protein